MSKSRKTTEDPRQKQIIRYNELADRFQPKLGRTLGYSEITKVFSSDDPSALKKMFQHVLAVLWHAFYKNGRHMKHLVEVDDIKWATIFLGFSPLNFRLCYREDQINFLALGEALKYLYHKHYIPAAEQEEHARAKQNRNFKDPMDALQQIYRPVYCNEPFFNELEKWYREQMDKLHNEQRIIIQIRKTIEQYQNIEEDDDKLVVI